MQLHATTDGLDALGLVPGRDLVTRAAIEHGATLPHGVLLDDHLDANARAEVDAAAHRALAQWRAAVDPVLSWNGVSLSEIWHVELFSEIFLPAVHLLFALRAALRDDAPGDLVARRLGPTRVGAARAAMEPAGWRVRDATPGPDPIDAYYGRPPLTVRTLPARLVDLVGVPSMLRGEVLVLAYGTTVPVLERLATNGTLRPVVHGGLPPAPGLATRAARAGGWTGRPGLLSRARAARRADRRIAQARDVRLAIEVADANLGAVLARGALDFLAAQARETFAWAALLDRALGRGRVRAVLLPFDWEPPSHVVATVARRHGVQCLALQHGYEPRKVFSPGGIAGRVGVFSEWDLEATAEHVDGRIVGDTRRPQARPGRARRDDAMTRVVVLTEHRMRVSAHVDDRITAMHATTAIDAVREALPSADIVLRPHPSAARAPIERLATGLGARLDRTTPILELLAGADACVGATSTATLECALVGTPVVMLDLVGGWAPPLDGSTDVPYARNGNELAQLLPKVLAEDPPPGSSALLHGLGHEVDDPIAAVVAWVGELCGRPPE